MENGEDISGHSGESVIPKKVLASGINRPLCNNRSTNVQMKDSMQLNAKVRAKLTWLPCDIDRR